MNGFGGEIGTASFETIVTEMRSTREHGISRGERALVRTTEAEYGSGTLRGSSRSSSNARPLQGECVANGPEFEAVSRHLYTVFVNDSPVTTKADGTWHVRHGPQIWMHPTGVAASFETTAHAFARSSPTSTGRSKRGMRTPTPQERRASRVSAGGSSSLTNRRS